MEIRKVGVIGAGAIGAYFLWGMRDLPKEDIFLLAKGERKERLIRDGIVVNGVRYDYPVKTPQEAEKVDLLLIATKYGALSSILEDAKAVVKEDTIVLSRLNGIDSEEIVGAAVGMEHMLYSIMRISAERKGNSVYFDDAVTMGLWFGEKGHAQLTSRTQAVMDFFAKTYCKCTFKPDIITEMWNKYAINTSRNLPQAVLGVGIGAYDDSEHAEFISHRLWDEVAAVAKAKGITVRPYGFAVSPRKNAHLSTLQDLMAGRHTEIDMFAGAMIRMGKELGIPVPYCEYTFHAIKALEEKNDGKFHYRELDL